MRRSAARFWGLGPRGMPRALGAGQVETDADRERQAFRARPQQPVRVGHGASSRSVGESMIGCTTAIVVAALSASAFGPSAPHRRMTGVERGRASVATPIAVLPCRVCSSARPSPVMTRSAVSRASASPTSSATTSMPRRTRACAKPMRPAVVPPAAPAPGRSATSLPVTDSIPRPHVGECGIELRDGVGIGALLRAVRRGRATRAAERVRHVTGHDERGFGEPRVEAVDLDPIEPSERGSALGQLGATPVEQPGPERAKKAAAAIGGRGAAEADGDLPRSRVESGAQHVAGAAAGCEEGVGRRPLIGCQARQARRRRPSRRRRRGPRRATASRP